MSFPFKGIGFDWAYTLMDLGNEDDCLPTTGCESYAAKMHVGCHE